MNAIAITSNSAKQVGTRQSHTATFAKVLDGRKPPIRGLWERNGRFYTQITVENAISGEKSVRRVPLKNKDAKPVETAVQQVALLRRHLRQHSRKPWR